MAKMKKKSIVKGVVTGIAVGTATALVSNAMNKKSAVKKNAGKAVSAVAAMISAMQG